MDLTGRVAVVTGAGSGLGRGAARALAAQGMRVFALDRDEAAAASTAGSLGEGAVAIGLDVAVEGDVAAAFDQIEEGVGRLHVCVNAAGIAPSRKILDRSGPVTLEHVRQVIDVNLMGTLDVARRSAELMTRGDPQETGERGVIVNVSSGAATQGQRGQLAYAASKAAVIGAMLPMARDLAPFGIRVVTVAPGLFDTAMSGGFSEGLRASLKEMVLFPKRMGKPEEFGRLVVDIAENPYLNATTISLDAGVRMV